MAKGLSVMFPYYTIACAVGMVLALLPLPAHWRAGNTATIALGLANFIGCLISFVNTIVWRGNVKNPYPIWGDITVAIYTNLGMAIAGCTFAIVYRLWRVARTRSVLTTKQDVCFFTLLRTYCAHSN
jgi:pheromone a factor receptor